jgi:hypothetical protein
MYMGLAKFITEDEIYTNQEELNIIIIYGECRRNEVKVWHLYRERYPHLNHPSACTFENIC